MSKRRRHAALGRPYLPQPAAAWPAVGFRPTGRTSPCKFLSFLLLLAISPLSAVRAQTGGGGRGTTPGPTTGTISGVVTAQETGGPEPHSNPQHGRPGRGPAVASGRAGNTPGGGTRIRCPGARAPTGPEESLTAPRTTSIRGGFGGPPRNRL